MQDIKPDTSLYTDLPNKLRAFALFAESNEPAEYQASSGRWMTYERPGMLDASARFLANGQHDYRIKPKPRELWVLFATDGTMSGADEKKFQSINGGTVVRFVEQPE